MLRVGIVGLPNVGKSTLFNALTAAGAPAENYPFCTVEPNVGTVEVPDERLRRIQELAGSATAVPAFIRFVDIAGLVEGASRGEGLGNRFLAQIREVDALAHVLRCFEEPEVAHVMGDVDPVRDLEVVETELAIADLEVVERRLERVEKKVRSGEKDARAEAEALERIREALSRGVPVRALERTEGEERAARELQLLTAKPVLYVANVGEDALPGGGEWADRLRARMGGGRGAEAVVAVCSALEAELVELEPGDRREFLAELGLPDTGLERMIRAAYELLGLVTFFTTNEKETHAWTVPRGTRAPVAAGVVHTDFEEGFIRAETISFEEFVRHGSLRAAREHGAVRSEGRDYVVEDGDILLFRFHV